MAVGQEQAGVLTTIVEIGEDIPIFLLRLPAGNGQSHQRNRPKSIWYHVSKIQKNTL